MKLNRQKAKGNQYEMKIAKRLSTHLGIELRRNPGSGNMERWKGDIIPIDDHDRIKWPWCIELKNQKTLMIPKWIRQTEREAEEMGKKPALIFHLHGTSKEYALIKLEDFMELNTGK